MNENIEYSLISGEEKSQLFNYVEKKIFSEKGIQITSDIIKSLEKINYSYYLMEELFEKIIRENGEKYFEHLKQVALIIINEIDYPTVEKVIIAILHDSIEDLDEVDFDFIRKIYGDKIAISVQAITKKHWKLYLTKEELEEYEINPNNEIKNKGKELRNQDYYGHLDSFEKMKNHINDIAIEKGIMLSEDDLKEITENTILVKFADRIHNLRTQWNPNNLEKVNRKIEETEKYFLKIAKDISIQSYNILQSLIFELKAKLISLKVNLDCIK